MPNCSRRHLLAGIGAAAVVSAAAPRPIEDVLRQRGLEIPPAPGIVGSYAPYRRKDDMVYVSGQLPWHRGALVAVGTVPDDVSLADAQLAARHCGLNILAVLRAACSGDLGRVEECIKLTGFVAAAPGFRDQPAVINGASDLMIAAFGERGRHARSSVGVQSLPLGATVEVEALFRTRLPDEGPIASSGVGPSARVTRA